MQRPVTLFTGQWADLTLDTEASTPATIAQSVRNHFASSTRSDEP